jgi:chorismate lyase/3-hydroxybenzoate synthase
MQEISQMYYQQLIDFIAQQKKPHLIRMWNYFPDIHHSDNGLERYQQFCVGRYQAFTKDPRYPAASAVGSHSSEMIILFIAAKQPGIFIENPEQVSAYQYPCDYSPKSPSFARACLYQEQGLNQFYISGTASIVGHKSQFINDILGQTKQTINNLKTLIQYANEQEQLAIDFDPHDEINYSQAIKVYLRKPADFQKITPLIQEFTPSSENICFLQADICRRELDIEIEVLFSSRL